MKKILYVHIGAHKTGTTAIQMFLSINRENLIRNGYYYPPGVLPAHHFVPHSLMHINQIYANPDEITHQLIKDIDEAYFDNILISSEDFENLNRDQILQFKDMLPEKFSVKIIYYIRRQDEVLESRYNQLVKGSSHYKEEFSKFLFFSPHEKEVIDYSLVLQKWREVFGQDNIIVRVYEKEQLPHGIFWDFLTAVNLEMNDSYRIPQQKFNPSLNWDLVEFIRICNIQFKNDSSIHKFLLNTIKKVKFDENSEKRHLFSPEQRRNLIEHYAESNMKVAHEYLSRSNGKLFYAPLPDLNEPWEPYDGLTVEKIVPIFTQMLYNMDVKYREQTRNRYKKVFIEKNPKLAKLLSNLKHRLL